MTEEFDVFTDEIKFTKPLYMNILNKYIKDAPSTPSGPNYQSGRKLYAEESLASNNELECAFNLSESVSASLRTMAVYREEQLKANGNKLRKITGFIRPVKDFIESHPVSKEHEEVLDLLSGNEDITAILESVKIEDEEEPLHKTYMRIGPENNVDNFQKILDELPKEWTVIQLTAPYNPNENLKPLNEFRTEIDSIFLSVFTNDYLDTCGMGPLTVNIPANVTREGEKPLFTELYSLLDDNYKTIDNAQFLNNKRLVQNYWNRREDIDLRMKSVISVMEKQWLGGWCSLLTGKLEDSKLRDRVIQLVDATVKDWGFIKLTPKQKILLYNLIECCPNLSSEQIKSCIRRILTEYGNTDDLRLHLDSGCQCCKDFKFPSEVCLKCLSKCFEKIHHFTLVDGIRAFSQAARTVREGDEWGSLRKAKRHPVILIVDEMLDTFPWESLPILSQHPVSRMENIHFLYYLYKIHEKDVIDGYFAAKADVGRYLINPEKNLDRMELRMKSFVEYWCGQWSGHASAPPPPPACLRHLAEADVFLYCGHGDGCRFAAPAGGGGGGGGGGGVESLRGVRGACVLSGCGSVRLARAAPRLAPHAAHHALHVAGSPMVVGMLWEVTDLEVDKVVSTLVSLYVPSTAPTPWPSVGKAKWSQGILDINVEQKSPFTPEPNLLKAISRARSSTNYVMIASSVVARGLPIRIHDKALS